MIAARSQLRRIRPDTEWLEALRHESAAILNLQGVPLLKGTVLDHAEPVGIRMEAEPGHGRHGLGSRYGEDASQARVRVT